MYTSKFSVIYSIGNRQNTDTHLLFWFWSVPGTTSPIRLSFFKKFNCWTFAKIFYMKNMILTYSKDFIFLMKKLTQFCPRFQGISRKIGCLSLVHISLWSIIFRVGLKHIETQTHPSVNLQPSCHALICRSWMEFLRVEREREREREWVKKRERDRKFISPPPPLL